MEPQFHDVLIALRRSRVKYRVYAALVRLGRASVAELADGACTDERRVRAVIHGDGHRYRHDTSLVALAVLRPTRGAYGQSYVVTQKGLDAWPVVDARLRAPGAGAAQVPGT